MTFLHKKWIKKSNKPGLHTELLEVQNGFWKPIPVGSIKNKLPKSSGTVTPPFTDKKGSQNRDASTNCNCIQLGISRMCCLWQWNFRTSANRSSKWGGRSMTLRSDDTISSLSFTTSYDFYSFKSCTKIILLSSDESQQVTGNYYLLQYCHKSFLFHSNE